MDTSVNRTRFLAYVADHPDARPAFHLTVRAIAGSEPPWFANTQPAGDVFAFPEFLVFLTTTTDRPGAKILVSGFVEAMTDHIKTGMTLNRWVAHPASMLIDVAKALANQGPKDDRLEQALASPNSFFVPFDRLKSVTAGSHFQGKFVRVATLDGDYIIHQDAMSEAGWKIMGTVLFGAAWEPKFTAYLQAAAARNASRTPAK